MKNKITTVKRFAKELYDMSVVVLGHTFTWIVIVGSIFGGKITIKLFTAEWVQKIFELFGF